MAITKAIVALTVSSGGSGFVQNMPSGGRGFEDNPMVLYENDRKILPSNHNRPLFVIAYVHDVELRRAQIDPGSSL